MMNLRTRIPSLIGFVFLVQACQPEHVASIEKTPAARDLDPAITQTIAAFGLAPDDLTSAKAVAKVTQKQLTVGQEKIAYFETSGKGPDVLLVHGNGQSSNAFSLQLQSVLGNVFHIIAIDLPGHGLSARSPSPSTTYQVPGYAALLVQVVAQLKMEHAVMVGWSLGGSILFEAADRLTGTPGMMVIGAPPVKNPFDPSAFLPSPVAGLFFQPDLTEVEIQSAVPALFKPNAQNIPSQFFQDLRIQDPLARLNVGLSLFTGNYKDEATVARNLTVPLAVVEGAEEQLTSLSYIQGLTLPTLWHHQVWVVPNAGHAAQFENPGYFNALLAAFVIENSVRTLTP